MGALKRLLIDLVLLESREIEILVFVLLVIVWHTEGSPFSPQNSYSPKGWKACAAARNHSRVLWRFAG